MSDIFYQSELNILNNVPLTSTLNHQLFFSNSLDRDNYFNGKISRTWNDFKYIREENKVQIPGIETEYYNVNYMRFRNKETDGIWVYAFVLSTEYVNTQSTKLIFKVDAWQTYFNFLTVKDCDIERMHVSDKNNNWRNYVLNEGIEIGDYTILENNNFLLDSVYLDGTLIMSTIDLITSGGDINNPIINTARGGIYMGSASACALYYTNDISSVMEGLLDYPWVASGIIGIYPISSDMIQGGYVMSQSKMGFNIGSITKGTYPLSKSIQLTLDLPPVQNKKLYTYPYTYISISAPDGNNIILKPELLSSDIVQGHVIYSLIPTPTIHLYIYNYMGVKEVDRYTTSLTFNQFPSFPCINDQYTLAKEQTRSMDNLISKQAQAEIKAQWYGAVGSAIGGGFEAGAGGFLSGAIEGSIKTYNSYNQEQRRAEKARLSTNQITTAPQLCGTSNAGACAPVFGLDRMINFRMNVYSVVPTMRNNIDKYFSVYGYKINQIKTPNLTAEGLRYKYIKCNHVNIFGDIPQYFLEEIREMFLDGVTLWYDVNNVGVY